MATRQNDVPGPGRGGTDWEGIEQSPEFRELVHTRRRLLNLLLALAALALVIYTVLLVTAGDGFLGDGVIGRFTWSMLLLVLMTVAIFSLAAVYSRVSINKLDPLVERTRAAAFSSPGDDGADRSGARRASGGDR